MLDGHLICLSGACSRNVEHCPRLSFVKEQKPLSGLTVTHFNVCVCVWGVLVCMVVPSFLIAEM